MMLFYILAVSVCYVILIAGLVRMTTLALDLCSGESENQGWRLLKNDDDDDDRSNDDDKNDDDDDYYYDPGKRRELGIDDHHRYIILTHRRSPHGLAAFLHPFDAFPRHNVRNPVLLPFPARHWVRPLGRYWQRRLSKEPHGRRMAQLWARMWISRSVFRFATLLR